MNEKEKKQQIIYDSYTKNTFKFLAISKPRLENLCLLIFFCASYCPIVLKWLPIRNKRVTQNYNWTLEKYQGKGDNHTKEFNHSNV